MCLHTQVNVFVYDYLKIRLERETINTNVCQQEAV